MTEKVFDIQRFSVDDGPGIRSIIFLCGCPLSCIWCHNPEGMRPARRLLYNAERCSGCGACEETCPKGAHVFRESENGVEHLLDRERCIVCGECAKRCPNDALTVSSTEMSVKAAFDELISDLPFYKNSGGGVTFSGGEPLAHEDFLIALAKKLREAGVHVAVETSGYVRGDSFERMAEHIDLFLFDVKESDRERHREVTGVYPELILENLATLARLGKPTVLRCPLIPDVNDRPDHAAAIAAIAEAHSNVSHVEIMPYHSLGLSKYARLGITPKYSRSENLSREQAEAFAALVRASTSKAVKLG